MNADKQFDLLFARADAIVKKYNPCEIKKELDGSISCLASRKKININGYPIKNNELCCDGCEFHTKNGCNADKPLSCKVWLCHVAASNSPECSKQLSIISKQMYELNFFVNRGDRNESLDKAAYHQNFRTRLNFCKMTVAKHTTAAKRA